jgi:ribosomal protein S18 acetylase RimI-like enzyme
VNLLQKVVLATDRGLSCRTVSVSDAEFLQELYGTTRSSEMAMVPWGNDQKARFIEVQFKAQHKFYQDQFAQAEFGVISKNDVDIGRLYIDQRESELRIIDIALMPNYQKMGLGKALLKAVQTVAIELQRPITIHVEKNNPAMTLYEKLGYEFLEDQGVYHLMRWTNPNNPFC